MDTIKEEYAKGLKKRANEYMLTLRIISNVPKEGKLNTYGGSISIYQESFTGSLVRLFYGDGRQNCLDALQKLYGEVNSFSLEFTKFIIDEKIGEGSITKDLYNNLAIRIKESKCGLLNLAHSYNDDATFYTKIMYIADDVISPIVKMMCSYNEADHSDDSTE